MDYSIDLPGVQRALGVRGPFGRLLGKYVFNMLKLDEFNQQQKNKCNLPGPVLTSRILKDIGVSYHIPEGQLEHIPREGGFIIVSNPKIRTFFKTASRRTVLEAF